MAEAERDGRDKDIEQLKNGKTKHQKAAYTPDVRVPFVLGIEDRIHKIPHGDHKAEMQRALEHKRVPSARRGKKKIPQKKKEKTHTSNV